jgi:hypothetical protein
MHVYNGGGNTLSNGSVTGYVNIEVAGLQPRVNAGKGSSDSDEFWGSKI